MAVATILLDAQVWREGAKLSMFVSTHNSTGSIIK
jgi:hypothetical protein